MKTRYVHHIVYFFRPALLSLCRRSRSKRFSCIRLARPSAFSIRPGQLSEFLQYMFHVVWIIGWEYLVLDLTRLQAEGVVLDRLPGQDVVRALTP